MNAARRCRRPSRRPPNGTACPASRGDQPEHRLTQFGVWLIEHAVAPWHSRPHHPQSRGKNERFNRTLNAELLQGRTFDDLDQAQRAFDAWRHRYNHHRPHDAFELAVLADRYRPSVRSFNPLVLPFDYGPDDIVRSRGPHQPS